MKDWNRAYAPLPTNYILLDPARGDDQLPPGIRFDVALSQNKFGQLQLLKPIATRLQLPLVSLEHTLPHPSWPHQQLAALKGMRGDLNVFISEYSRSAWGWADSEAEVIRHGVDTKAFSPARGVRLTPHVLSVVNQYRERIWCCGYDFWEVATAGLPRLHLGESPDGWSQPAQGIADLVSHYRRCAVFVDTASASPIPSVVLEAMACGAVVVSRGNAMVPEVITDGVNGFIRKEAGAMRALLADILAQPEAYESIRTAARQTILERFSLECFVSSWDSLLRRAADLVYTGESR